MKFLKHWWVVLVVAGFLLSRIYILKNPPCCYSDVTHDYERYANMWYYGLPPYLKHFYEYPPATIPILYVPLWLDQHGIGKYYLNYRLGIFLIDGILFFFLLRLWWHWPQKKATKIISILFYLISPMIAKDFFYEGIDLAFVAPLAIAFILLFLYSQKTTVKRAIFWALFWLSFAIKFMSLPLIVPFFYLKSVTFKKELVALFLGFLIIWGLPLAIFRSSLSVSFVFHARRPLKYASFPAYLVETVNRFTQSEVRVNQPPDFQLEGPVSTAMTQIFNLIFPISIILVIFYALKQIFGKLDFKKWRLLLKQLFFIKQLDLTKLDLYTFATKITLIFFLTIFLTGKIFSQPFHIWYLPLITIFPFSKVRQQLSFMLLALWLLIVDTTPWIKINENAIFWAPLTWKFVTYFFRFLPMFILLILSFKLPNKIELHNRR